jgi:intein/homing endonuclease
VYHPTVIARRIEEAIRSRHVYYEYKTLAGAVQRRYFEPTYHSLSEIESSVSHLAGLVDADAGTLKRPLEEAEIAFIANERLLCRLNYIYYAKNYCWIKDEEGRNVRYKPRIPQQIFQDIVAEHDLNEWPIELQVLKARQLGLCLHPSTLILSADLKWIPLNEVEPGMEIVAVDEFAAGGKGSARKMRTAKVEARRDVFEPAYRLDMDNGETLIATGEHRFLCRMLSSAGHTEWKHVSDVQSGDQIRHITKPWGAPGLEDAWFGGLLDGEGSMRPKHRGGAEACVAQVPGAVYDRARKYIVDRGFSFHEEVDNRKPGESSKFGSKPVCKITVNRMNELFRLLGQTRPTRFIEKRWWEGKELPGKHSGVAWSKVVSITPLEKQRMIDLTTTTGTFIANGFVSHNSREISLMFGHRTLFWAGVNAVLASADPGKSSLLAAMLEYPIDRLPWWLSPTPTLRRTGVYIEYGQQDSKISIEAGSQFNGIARGTTPTCVHLSELCLGGDTQVITATGLRAMRDISVGELVLSSDGELHVVRAKKQTERTDQAIEITVWGADDFPVWSTPDHRFLCEDGWKEASAIVAERDWIVHPGRSITAQSRLSSWRQPGYWRWTEDGNIACQVKSAGPTSRACQYFDIEVEGVHDFCTTAGIAHNCEFVDPEELVEASLFPAIHPSRWTFMVLESTALGRGNWWHNTWKLAKENWHHGRSRLRPVFLPWFTGSDIYPKQDWVRMNQSHIDAYKPSESLLQHASAAQHYVRTDPLLRKYLGADWQMSKEQMFWYEVKRDEYREKGILGKFLSEYCIAGSERVSTEKGILPIEQVVLEKAGLCECGPILGHFDNGVREIVEIATGNGRTLLLTADHRVNCTRNGESEWVAAAELKKGDTLTLSPPRFADSLCVHEWYWTPGCRMSIEVGEDWGRMMGYFLGDGCWGSNAVIVTCNAKDEDVIADVSELMERTGGKYPLHQRQRGAMQVTSNSVRWFEMISSLGLIEHRWSKSQQRNSGFKKRLRVPECIWRSPRRVVAQFLRGLFESDGFAHTASCQIGFFTKDPVFARQIQLLLLGFGVNAIYHREKKERDGKVFYGTKLRLNARAAEIFYSEVGFVSHRKQSGRRCSVKRGRKPDPIIMADEVMEVKAAGTAPVFDVTVAGQHCFGANGILVHNCSSDEESFQSTNISVFEIEDITWYRQTAKTKSPLGVFGLVCRDDIFPKRLQPGAMEIDHSQSAIEIKWPWGQQNIEFTLVPLKWHGYGDSDGNGLGKIFIFEMPDSRSTYGFGVDTGDGVGKDRSVVQVIRKGNVFGRSAQVAEYANPYVNAHDLWPIAAALAVLYSLPQNGMLRQPRAAIECRGNGDTVQHELMKRGYHNFHPWVRIDNKRIQPGKANKIGVYTSGWFRKQIMDWILVFLRDRKIDINSPYLVGEMEALEADEYSQALKAAYGAHDDRLMALGFIIVSLYQLEIMRGQSAEDQEAQQEETDPVFQAPAFNTAEGQAGLLARMSRRPSAGLRPVPNSQGVTRRVAAI